MTCEGKSIGTLVLQASLVQLVQTVGGSVITCWSIDVREIETWIPCPLEHRHIGFVGQPAVRFVQDRISPGWSPGTRQFFDQPAISVTGLKHQRRTFAASCFEVKHYSNVFGPGMLVDKRSCTHQAHFFSISEKENDVILKTFTGAQSPHRFKHCCDCGAVVARAGTGRNRIVMANQNNCLAVIRAFQPDHDVFNCAHVKRCSRSWPEHDRFLYRRR